VFFRIVRACLIVWTLLATALCIASVVATGSHQQSAAATMIQDQNLRDLRTEVAHAQALAFTYCLDPQDPAWTAYQTSSDQIDTWLLTAAANASNPSDLTGVASAIRQWQDGIVIAHQEAQTTGVSASTAQSLQTLYSAIDAQITAHSTPVGAHQSASVAFLVIGLVMAGIGVLGFLAGLVLTARRTRRFLNIGLAVGLLAMVGTVTVIGVYAGHSAAAQQVDSRVAIVSEAQAQTWDSQSMAAMSVLDPLQASSYEAQTRTLVQDIQATLTRNGLANKFVDDLNQRQDTIANTSDPAQRSSLIVDSSPWTSQASVLGSMISSDRPDEDSLVVQALWYIVMVAAACVIAIIATLAGIHARTREYA